MQSLKKLTIRYKLILLMVATSLMSLTLVGFMFILWGYVSARQSSVKALTTHAKVIASGCQAALAFDDPEDATSVLGNLKMESSVVWGGVYNGDTCFAIYYRPDTKPVSVDTSMRYKGYYFKDGYLTVFSDIRMDDNRGTRIRMPAFGFERAASAYQA